MAHLLPQFGGGIQMGTEEGVGKTLAIAAFKYDDGNDTGYLKLFFPLQNKWLFFKEYIIGIS